MDSKIRLVISSTNWEKFKSRYDPEGAHAWLKKIENIFRVMACTEEYKVFFGTYMFSKEVKDWWNNAR